MEAFLLARLRAVGVRRLNLVFARDLAVCWSIAAFAALVLVALDRFAATPLPFGAAIISASAGVATIALSIRRLRAKSDDRAVARLIEAAHPELKGLVLTALQAGGSPADGADASGGYLRYVMLRDAVDHAQKNDWRNLIPRGSFVRAYATQVAALVCFAIAIGRLPPAAPAGAVAGIEVADGVVITPGDTEIEKGESLVILARFGDDVPGAVNLVIREDGRPERTVPLTKSLADPVFGGSVASVANSLTYRLDYAGEQTREFKVRVFEHPRLERADAALTFPTYTEMPAKRIADTRRLSAVEGTTIDLALQLNKPVASAALVARDAAKTRIPLVVESGKATATLPGWLPLATQTYDVQLVDADGRANKPAPPFIVEVVPNRPPELRLAAPRGDVRPSMLQEIGFEGSVWDDFGSPSYGLGYNAVGAETTYVELGKDAPARQRRDFAHPLRLEELGVEPDALLSWFVWADDIGPDGKLRRTTSDLYFAEVRRFDEIYREDKGMQGQPPPGAQGGGQGSPTSKLTELQKQIINATWKLQRSPTNATFAQDAAVVLNSQKQALAQATEQRGQTMNPTELVAWSNVAREMERAVDQLAKAADNRDALSTALSAEQSAYQSLLKLQARETSVTRGQRGGGGGGGQQANQQQIDELDLDQSENRYETQRQVQTSGQNPERTEQLQVQNRLQELARRQDDVNDRLKELQTALQQAADEQAREEIRRRLKRLEEEQRQMLADADELRQRMDRPENQSRMSEERQRLEQARNDLQKSAEATGQGQVSQALSSGTRAQRQLQELRDEMRKENSSEFAEELRQMRNDARDLARRQEDVAKELAGMDQNKRQTLGENTDRQAVLDRLAEQQKRMESLTERATRISQESENSEPLLSRQLYDSLRKLGQDDAGQLKQIERELVDSGQMTRALNDRLQKLAEKDGAKSLELTTELARAGLLPQAAQSEQRARAAIDELKRGVERAAESVLGDDAEALKLAQQQLDRITDELQREAAQAQAGGPRGPQPGSPGQDGEPSAAGQEPGQGQGQGEGASRDNRPPEERLASVPTPGAGESPGGESPGSQAGDGAGASGEGSANSLRDVASSDRAGQRRRDQRGDNARGGRGSLTGTDNRGGEGGGLDRIDIGELLGGGGGGDLVGNGGRVTRGPLTGDDFSQWTDRLREVEELVDTPELRDAVAAARERARQLRRDFKQDLKKPDWAVVQLQIVKPLLEVRSRVAEELARRTSSESLVPIDRDPVPARFAESVRKYYEELGKDGQ